MSEAFTLGVKPPSELDPPEWMTQNVKLASSEWSNKFDITQAEWLRAPLMCLADPYVNQVVFYAPTGCGKSTMAEALIPWVVNERPAPFLYMSQTNATSKTWKETRLDFALKSCEYVRKLWPKDRHKSRVADIIFPHMPLHIRGANISNCQELSMTYLYADEVWRWSPELLREFLGRHHNRLQRKVYLVSQAGYANDSMDVAYKETDENEWSFECECGEWHKYSRDILKYDLIKNSTNDVDMQKSANTARIVCPDCGKIYKDDIKTRRALYKRSAYRQSSTECLSKHKGFRMHRLGVWRTDWSEYVITTLKAKAQLDMGVIDAWRQTHQKDDCVAWADDMGMSMKDMKVSHTPMRDRDPKMLIENETFRTFCLDKGGDHFWGTIRAWANGEASELLWEGYIPATTDEFRIQELQEEYAVQSNHVFVDIGFEWSITAALCAKNGWWGIRGGMNTHSYQHDIRGGGKVEKLYSKVRYTTGDDGSRCRYIEIATNPIKDILWRLMNGSGLNWTIPPDVSKAYRNHMKSETRKTGPRGKEKKIIEYWECTNRQNHLWDCEVYSVAAALIFGIFGD